MARKRTPKRKDARPALGEQTQSYVEQSRRPALSILLSLPLVVLYQIGIVQAGSSTRNIAEIWMTGPLSRMGMHTATLVNVLVLAALLYGLYEAHKTGGFYLGFMGIMLMEGLIYALLLFSGVSVAAHAVERAVHRFLAIQGMSGNTLLLSLGAGVYEELLFRLIRVGGGALLLQKVFLWDKLHSGAAMLVVSSLLFSAAHHVGPCGEAFTPFAFIFRAICGAALGVLFLARGLGIAVWTHAIYNVLVLATT
jgi:hypothetical protein